MGGTHEVFFSPQKGDAFGPPPPVMLRFNTIKMEHAGGEEKTLFRRFRLFILEKLLFWLIFELKTLFLIGCFCGGALGNLFEIKFVSCVLGKMVTRGGFVMKRYFLFWARNSLETTAKRMFDKKQHLTITKNGIKRNHSQKDVRQKATPDIWRQTTIG